eukprot:689262-Pleurochrysis_carterae.AAC.1
MDCAMSCCCALICAAICCCCTVHIYIISFACACICSICSSASLVNALAARVCNGGGLQKRSYTIV